MCMQAMFRVKHAYVYYVDRPCVYFREIVRSGYGIDIIIITLINDDNLLILS